MSNDFENMMNQMSGAFDNAQAMDFSGDVPDGEYVCLISGCTINQAKSSGRWQISWDLQIIWDPKGKFSNRHIFIHDGITSVDRSTGKHEPNDIGMGIIKRRFKVLGMEVTSNNLGDAILKALGNAHMTGPKLLEKAGYDYSSHYRGILSNLVKRGLLGNDHTGYYRIS